MKGKQEGTPVPSVTNVPEEENQPSIIETGDTIFFLLLSGLMLCILGVFAYKKSKK